MHDGEYCKIFITLQGSLKIMYNVRSWRNVERLIKTMFTSNDISALHISKKSSGFISFLTFMNHVEFIKSIIYPTSCFTTTSICQVTRASQSGRHDKNGFLSIILSYHLFLYRKIRQYPYATIVTPSQVLSFSYHNAKVHSITMTS